MTAIGSACSSSAQAESLAAVGRARQGHRGGSAGFMKDLESALTEAGAGSDQVQEIKKQVQAAVEEARKNGGDRGAVKAAVEKVVQQNGLNLDAFQAAMQKARESHRRPDADGDGDGTPGRFAGMSLGVNTADGSEHTVDVMA